eukprot:scaffold1019_cov338-Pavlova_lutheri.AAC.14
MPSSSSTSKVSGGSLGRWTSTFPLDREETPGHRHLVEAGGARLDISKPHSQASHATKRHGARAVDDGCRRMGRVRDPHLAAFAVRVAVDAAAGPEEHRRTTGGDLREPCLCAQRRAVRHRRLLVDADASRRVRMEGHQRGAGAAGRSAPRNRTGAQRRHLSRHREARCVLRLPPRRNCAMARWIPFQRGATPAVRGRRAHRVGNGVPCVSCTASRIARSCDLLDRPVHRHCPD